ncbi:MAG: acyl-CoA dehydrogenase family protein [Aigarchaeota archaeon]|nr:acyl-CoA dehydrogenase family protein [Candidatus Pelearchaeum maunauluense]
MDKLANPRHVMWSIRGERVDAVLLDQAQRWVLERLMREYKVNQPPFRGGSWHEHFAAIYLVSDPGIACILTVTIQTAYALAKYGGGELKRFVPHLIGEAEPIMYGATWFTEIQGGGDLGANLTKAVRIGDSWRLSGSWKYFTSNAGLADVALVTARPEGAPPGVKVGLFLVPRTRPDGSANFTIRRLKLKSATKSVPTGEVEFNDAVAYPVGELEKGIYYVLEDLRFSRLANSAGALGIARKAFLEALGYTRFRRAFGKKLIEHPLVVHDLLEMELLIDGGLALMFKAVQEFQSVSDEVPPTSRVSHHSDMGRNE